MLDNPQYTRNDQKLISKKIDLRDVNFIIDTFREYIKYPKFGDDDKFSSFQKKIVRECTQETVEQTHKEIIDAIPHLTTSGIHYISVPGWEKYFLNAVPEQKEKIYKAEFLIVTNYMSNAEKFHEVQPYFYDEGSGFWWWDKEDKVWEEISKKGLMVKLHQKLTIAGETVNNHIRGSYLEAFARTGIEKRPKDPSLEWIQFKDTIYDLKTYKRFPATPEYYFVNSIPWTLGDTTETPVMDQLFREWVDEKDVTTLYEWLAYCCYRAYPLHHQLSLLSGGSSGKGQFFHLLRHFLGKRNCTASELVYLTTNRFASYTLYKKLVCLMAEGDHRLLKSTTFYKSATSGDPISFERKGRDPFTGVSYAKLTLASNALPPVDDDTDGFYRRQLIVKFPNTFPNKEDVWKKVPDQEYNNLALKVCKILPNLLKKGFTNVGSVAERKIEYQKASNPLPFFIKEFCIVNTESFVPTTELYNCYKGYLRNKKVRIVSRKAFIKALDAEAFYQIKVSRKTV